MSRAGSQSTASARPNSPSLADRHRSGPRRPESDGPFQRILHPDHAGTERLGHPCRGRPHGRPNGAYRLLPGHDQPGSSRAQQIGRPETEARNAGGNLYRNGSPHDAWLHPEATGRPTRPRLPRKLRRSDMRPHPGNHARPSSLGSNLTTHYSRMRVGGMPAKMQTGAKDAHPPARRMRRARSARGGFWSKMAGTAAPNGSTSSRPDSTIPFLSGPSMFRYETPPMVRSP